MQHTLNNYINSSFEFQKELELLFESSSKLVIFDIGACEGEDSVKFSRQFPNAKIYTFEPLPKNIKRIKENFKTYGVKNAKVYPLALSNKAGRATFHVSSGKPPDVHDKDWDYGNKSSSLLPPGLTKKVHGWLKFKDKISVKTERLDSFLIKEGIDEIDFVYMDVQGAEMMVLDGAGEFIKKIKAIWLEVESVELYKNQPLKNDVEVFMNGHGFIKIKDTVNKIAGDQLYVKKILANKLPGKRHYITITKAKRNLRAVLTRIGHS